MEDEAGVANILDDHIGTARTRQLETRPEGATTPVVDSSIPSTMVKRYTNDSSRLSPHEGEDLSSSLHSARTMPL